MIRESKDNVYDNAEKLVEKEKLKEFIRRHLGERGYGVTKALYRKSRRICCISYGNFRIMVARARKSLN